MVDSNDPINIDLGDLQSKNAAIQNINSSFVDTKDKILDVNKELEELDLKYLIIKVQEMTGYLF